MNTIVIEWRGNKRYELQAVPRPVLPLVADALAEHVSKPRVTVTLNSYKYDVAVNEHGCAVWRHIGKVDS